VQIGQARHGRFAAQLVEALVIGPIGVLEQHALLCRRRLEAGGVFADVLGGGCHGSSPLPKVPGRARRAVPGCLQAAA